MSINFNCVDRSFGLIPKDSQLENVKVNSISALNRLVACNVVTNEIDASVGNFDVINVNTINSPPGPVSDVHVWRYAPDSVSGRPTVQLNPAFPGAIIPSDLVFPTTTEEGASTRLVLDIVNGSFRAGQVSGIQWDQVNRGLNSVAFGLDNTASGIQSAVGGGTTNIAAAALSTIAGGSNNSVNGDRSFIGGGSGNVVTALAPSSVIGGGFVNSTAADTSFIGGGNGNSITNPATYSAICGGDGNSTDAIRSFIGSGFRNHVYPGCDGGVINSGSVNEIGGNGGVATFPSLQSCIGSGIGNQINPVAGQANEQCNVIVGGSNNQINQSAILGGNPGYNFIGSGLTNSIDGELNVIGGGFTNQIINTEHAFIGAGRNHQVNGARSFIGAGFNNQVAAAGASAFIGAGQSNRSDAAQSGVVAGISNQAQATNSFIGGGTTHRVFVGSDNSGIGAGSSNSVTTSERNFIGGGLTNSIITSPDSFIGGGNANSIAVGGNSSFIGAGTTNNAAGDNSFIGAGNLNSVTASNSQAAGQQALAYNTLQDVLAHGQSAIKGDRQVSRYVAQSDPLSFPLLIRGSPPGGLDLTITLPFDGAWAVTVEAVGKDLANTAATFITLKGVVTIAGGVMAVPVFVSTTNATIGAVVGAGLALSSTAGASPLTVIAVGTSGGVNLIWTAEITLVECI